MATENFFSDLSKMIEQVGKDKGIDRTIVVDAVGNDRPAVVSTCFSDIEFIAPLWAMLMCPYDTRLRV